jgi:hypothetical protein
VVGPAAPELCQRRTSWPAVSAIRSLTSAGNPRVWSQYLAARSKAMEEGSEGVEAGIAHFRVVGECCQHR